ncbi:CaiB/BaiF CoA transferase family protein [Sphingopyxis macrogoltabida]|uniref:Formyl-CoA transferase n=1 Tax=Sphingopyxis macrogoltabida TaxID=33050 RepID=A0AAC8Z043_SPHMC|nr:CoA transferase [Sphingopyxis macrogoltabida]ALJ13059.1 formyl-CoA transferase [Sphingopyxis macrogoltabida]AMU89475.1 formyl-CoA transferase [Sphingopyxis macrogoltabida]
MPLTGIRVIDFGRYIAGPYCAALLADYGADVIRIEAPEGNEDRYSVPVADDGSGAMFLQMNRNKRSLGLKPGSEAGREVVRRLVRTADVVVANMPDDALEKLGLDYPTLSALNPAIILVTASAFGSEEPLAQRVGFDAVGQAMSGAVYLGGSDGAPARAQVNYVDFTTALHCAFGVMLALRERERTGKGQRVSGSLLGSALAISNGLTIDHALNGVDRGMMGSRAFSSAPTDIFATRDGWVMTQVVGNPIFARWAALIGRPELADDPRFGSDIARGEHGAELSILMAEWCAARTTDDAIAELGAARVPAGPVLRPSEALAEPQVAAAGLVEPMEYPGIKGTAPIVRTPITLSANAKAELSPAPRVGEHGEAILAELGYDHEAISALRRDRII